MNADWIEDARKIPDEFMSHIRRLAVMAVVEDHQSPELVAKIFKISRSSIYEWLSWFKKGGYDALDTLKAPGKKPIITPEIELWLKHTILHSNPSDYGYDTELWTIKIIAELLKKQFGIKVCESTISNHLHQIGLSCQVPQYRSDRYNQSDVDRFISVKWPKIQRLADKIGADILFEDEAGIGVRTRSGRTWGEVNKPPIVPKSDLRGGYNMLSAIDAKGDIYYEIQDKHISSDEYIEFLNKIILLHPRPVIIITDNASFHRSKKVREFVRANREKIRVFFLPKHAPHLNPDEQVWNEVKHRTIERQPVLDKDDLFDRIVYAFQDLRKNTMRILSFFKLRDTKYAMGAA